MTGVGSDGGRGPRAGRRRGRRRRRDLRRLVDLVVADELELVDPGGSGQLRDGDDDAVGTDQREARDRLADRQARRFAARVGASIDVELVAEVQGERQLGELAFEVRAACLLDLLIGSRLSGRARRRLSGSADRLRARWTAARRGQQQPGEHDRAGHRRTAGHAGGCYRSAAPRPFQPGGGARQPRLCHGDLGDGDDDCAVTGGTRCPRSRTSRGQRGTGAGARCGGGPRSRVDTGSTRDHQAVTVHSGRGGPHPGSPSRCRVVRSGHLRSDILYVSRSTELVPA